MCSQFTRVMVAVCLFSSFAICALAQTQANSDPVYLQLRKVGLGPEGLGVSNVVLKRDAGTFTFRSGNLCFLAPVNGKVTGAVFVGVGSFSLKPPLDTEQRPINLLTNGQPLTEEFNELVLRFTDDTYEQLKKAPGATPGGTCPADALNENVSVLQHNLHYNISGRVLQDVLGEGPGGLFMAFIKGKKHSGKMVYAIDVHGVPELPGQAWESDPNGMPPIGVAPEEVSLFTWDPNKFGIWSAFHYTSEYAANKAHSAQQNNWIDIEKQELDASFDKNGRMDGKAATTFTSHVNGLRVIALDLFPTLRVQSVTDAAGQPLAFIQEDKNLDPQFFVILPKALAAGESCVVKTAYNGKDAVRSEGVGNYYPIARTNWYPSSGRLDDYATYDIRFAIPKGMTMVATGNPVSEAVEGDQVVSRWTSEQPQTVAGFQFGRVKKMTANLGKNFAIESYANTEPPDSIKQIQATINQSRTGRIGNQSNVYGATLDVIDTTAQIQNAIADAQGAVPLYADYFGPVTFKRLAITQQTATNYGQAWPGLVWLPMSYFWDSTIRKQLGFSDVMMRGYFTVVGPHEIAHQWWGHTIVWGSYRDQWMSEGFAEFSAALYLQRYSKDPMAFVNFYNDELELLLMKNAQGYRPIDVGPVTLGLRTITTKAGEDIYRRLIYAKGGYILHMIRMMMFDRQTGDEKFKAMMREFVKTFAGHPATTEDFKAIVEKHMTPAMDLQGNHSMDWFFNEYVYGTALPHYALDYSLSRTADGTPVLKFKLTQSGVDENFGMPVPLYLDFGKNNIIKMGAANMIGNKTIEQEVPLAGLKEQPKRLVVNYFNDVLAVIDGQRVK